MGFIEGIAGFAYLMGDVVATIAFACAVSIAGAAVLNLISEWPVNAPFKIYLAFFLSIGLGLVGQLAVWVTGLQHSVSGIFGLTPNYPLLTLGLAIAMFVIGLSLRKDKYAYL